MKFNTGKNDKEVSVFENFIGRNKENKLSVITFKHRFLFYAQTSFLIKIKSDLEKNSVQFKDWMRVMRNVAENTVISTENFHNSIQFIKLLLKCVNNDIYAFLIEGQEFGSNFSKKQMDEERVKAKLICNSAEWKEAIQNTENHTYFRGQIAFLLKFANSNFDKPDQECIYDFEKFQEYSKKAGAVFQIIDDNGSEGLDYLWERAVLSKEDYTIEYRNTVKYNFLSKSKTGENSWREFFSSPIDKLICVKNVLKDLSDSKKLNKDQVKDELAQICKKAIDKKEIENWRLQLINNSSLFHFCKQGYFIWEDNHIVYLIKNKNSGSNPELFTFSLYQK